MKTDFSDTDGLKALDLTKRSRTISFSTAFHIKKDVNPILNKGLTSFLSCFRLDIGDTNDLNTQSTAWFVFL